MKLTRRQAIRECKKLWREIKASGRIKDVFLFHTPQGRHWLEKGYGSYCPMIQYHFSVSVKTSPHTDVCGRCPLPQMQHGISNILRCVLLGYQPDNIPSPEWLAVVEGLKE